SCNAVGLRQATRRCLTHSPPRWRLWTVRWHPARILRQHCTMPPSPPKTAGTQRQRWWPGRAAPGTSGSEVSGITVRARDRQRCCSLRRQRQWGAASVTVGLVVVSHSRALARAAVGLAQEMLHGKQIKIAVAAGLDDTTFGTDAAQIVDAIMAAEQGA